MAQPANLWRTTWEFGLYDSGVRQEIAEFSVVWNPTVVPDVAEQDDCAAELAVVAYGAWKDNALGGNWETSVKLDSVTARLESTAGLTVAERTAVASGGSTWHGASSGGSLPWQVSHVIGLFTYTPGTFIPHQRRRKGRIYLPPYSASVLLDADSGQMHATAVAAVLDSIDAVLGAIQTHVYVTPPGFDPIPGVLSKVDVHHYALTDLRAQSILNTQRRRVEQEPTSYQSRTYDPTP